MSLLNNGKYKICISPKSAKRQGLHSGDVVRRQYFDGQNIIYSLMVVLETGVDRITTPEGDEQDSAYFIGALIDGDIPRSGQVLDFVRVTNLFDEARSGAMYLTASDSDSPYMDIIDGMARENSLCFPSDENNCRYTLAGKEFLSEEYFPYKDGCKRVFRIRRNGIPLTGSAGLNQRLGTGLGNPEKVIVSYKIRASRKLPSVPFSLGYTDGSETDGNGNISVSTDWEYHLSLISIDYLPQYERCFKLNLSGLEANDWCEIAELNIIRLSDIATFADATKARIGKVQGIVDPTFGKLDGYGAYFQRLYATQDVNIAGTLTAGDESGFASTFYVGRIHKNCLINSLYGNFLHPVEKVTELQTPAGIGDTFRLPAAGVTWVAQSRDWAEAHQGERHSFSFWAKAESPCTLAISQNGYPLPKVELTDGPWKRHHVSWVIRCEEPDDLLIEMSADTDGVLFCSAQLEKGGKPTLYQATDGKLTDTGEYGAWFARGGIGGTIQNPLLKLNADGSISAGDGSFVIQKDGTGYFAGGRFKWTQDTIALQDVTIRWEDFDDEAKENLRVKYVALTGTDIFHYANASQENSCEPKEIILSATEYNFAATVRKWQYLSADGDWKDIPENNSCSLQLLPLSSIWEGRKVLTLKYIATLDGCDYFDTITISKQYDGAAGSEANMLDWVKDWNSSKTVIGSETLITPKLFAGTKNNNHTITGIAIGRFPLSTMSASGEVTIETINGIYGFKDGCKTFAIDTTGSVQLGRGNQFIRFNAATGKVEFGPDVTLNWVNAINAAQAETINSAEATAQKIADAAKDAAINTVSKDIAGAIKLGTDAKGVAEAIANKAKDEDWATKLTYIGSTGIFTGTLSANTVNAFKINASQITAGTIDTSRINVTELKSSLITAGNIEALTLNVERGKIGGWSIGADTIYHVLNEKYMILKSGEGDSPVGSGRGHRGFTIYNDDYQVSEGQVKVVQMGALANAGTANVWSSETNYGFRIALKGGKDVFRADNTGATIAGWKMDTDALYRGTKNNAATSYTAAAGYLTIGSNGIRGFKWRLEADGSGALASGNISWNAAGNVTFASSVALAWSTPITAITTALGGSSFPKMTHISGTGIYTGTLTAGQVNAVAINASSITTGTLSADRIAANSIKAEKLDAASIKSQIINTAYINGLSCTFIRGSIGGWRMNDSYIIAMNPPEGHRVAMSNTGYLYNDDGARPYWALKADGSALFAHEKVKFSYDGSGFVANGNISWDAAGKVSFSPAVSLNWTDAIGALEIGGNNLLNNSGNWRMAGWNNGYASNGGGYTIDTGMPFNGNPSVKTDVGNGLVHSWLTLENNIEYTYSAMVRCNKTIAGNTDTPLYYWAGKDNVNQSKISVIKADTSVTANVWKRIFIVFKLTGDANSFRPFFYRGGNESTYYNIAYFKLERGNKPTDWCQSDSDANKLSTDAQNSANSITTALGGGSFPKLTKLSGTGIYTGTLTAEQINAVAINASSIKAGTLSADRIAANSIKADKLDANSIKSNLINVSYINGLTCTFNKGTIGGWRMNDTYIIAVNPPSGHRIAMSNTGYLYNDDGANDFWGLNADGSAVFAHGKAKFFNDGSGYIANGNISWDTAGKVSFSSSASLNWTNAIYEAKNANYGYQFHKDIIVKGDANTYYPVIIKGGDQTVKRDILVRRSYYEQAPVSWGEDASHIGGLNLLIKTNFGGWGGITYSWNIYELEECYCRMFAGAAVCGNSCMFAIFLRGGGSTGAIYHLYSNQSLEGHPYAESPVPTEAPQIAYNSDLIFKSGSYTAYAPAPRTLTASVESEIRQHRYAASTYISSSGIYTGSISAGQINVDTALVVGGSSYNGSVSVRNASNNALVTLDRSGITAIAGRIGGWTLESGAIYASSPTNGHRVRLLSNGYLYNDDGSKDYWGLNADGSATFGYGKILFKNDGSGYVANNNIRWDATGNVNITGNITATSGLIAGFTINGNKLINKASDSSIEFSSLIGNASLIINSSSALLSLRADSARTGIFIQTYATGAKGISIIANAGSKYAIESYGPIQFGQRSGERWCMPGVLYIGCKYNSGTSTAFSKIWGEGLTISSCSHLGSSRYKFYHNLGHTNYTVIGQVYQQYEYYGSFKLLERASTYFILQNLGSSGGPDVAPFDFIVFGRNTW